MRPTRAWAADARRATSGSAARAGSSVEYTAAACPEAEPDSGGHTQYKPRAPAARAPARSSHHGSASAQQGPFGGPCSPRCAPARRRRRGGEGYIAGAGGRGEPGPTRGGLSWCRLGRGGSRRDTFGTLRWRAWAFTVAPHPNGGNGSTQHKSAAPLRLNRMEHDGARRSARSSAGFEV